MKSIKIGNNKKRRILIQLELDTTVVYRDENGVSFPFPINIEMKELDKLLSRNIEFWLKGDYSVVIAGDIIYNLPKTKKQIVKLKLRDTIKMTV